VTVDVTRRFRRRRSMSTPTVQRIWHRERQAEQPPMLYTVGGIPVALSVLSSVVGGRRH
jgi:hypothetical protein